MRKPHSRVVAIIPARYESSRFPGKPLVSLLGKTLIQRTYENAKLCTQLDGVIVATDDQRIYDHVLSFQGKVVMTPKSCPTGTDRIAYVINNDPTLRDADIIVNVQGDEPCLNPMAIQHIIEALEKNKEAVMSSAAVRINNEEEALSSSDVKCVMDVNGYALYFSRALIPSGNSLKYRTDISYYKHLGIYAYRRDFLQKYLSLPATPLQMAEELEQLKVLEYGYKIKMAVVESFSTGVNTPNDVKKIEQELCRQNLSLS